MAVAISNEIRDKIIEHKQNGASQPKIAKWLIVSESTVTKVWRRFRQTGCGDALPKNSGRKPRVSVETMDKVVAKIHEAPDETLSELIDEFELEISESALCRRLRKLGLTYKKRRFTRTAKNAGMLSKNAQNGKKINRKLT